jgi:selenocysteine lyase/cysteine desulfurase
VTWTDPPDREEAGSPNVIGAVALDAAITELESIGFAAITEHDRALTTELWTRLGAVPGVRLLGPGCDRDTLPLATFNIDGLHHALVAARLSAEYGIGVRHGCFCAHPYLMRLLDLSIDEVAAYRDAVLHGDRHAMPGAVRASAGLSTSLADVERLVAAVRDIAGGAPSPVTYLQDAHTGDYWPEDGPSGWSNDDRAMGASCARG